MNRHNAAADAGPPPEISVVIPSYNRRESVLALLADVYRQEGVNFEVVVVDDCSPDGSADAIAERFPQATLLRNATNGGPCVTRNRGVRAARGEWIVGFDSDVTVPDAQLLAKVRDAFRERPDAAGFAFRLFKPDGVSEDAERWWHPLPIGKFVDRAFETSYFSGTGYAFRREAMLAAGSFPEILYMHYEEVALALRVMDGGGAIHYHPALTAVHHAHPVSRRSKIRMFYKPRNQALIALLLYPLAAGVRYLAPRLGFQFLSAIRGGHPFQFLLAMVSALKLAPAAWKERTPLGAQTWRRIAALRRQTPAAPRECLANSN